MKRISNIKIFKKYLFLTFLPAQPLSPTALSPHQAQSGKLSSMMKEEKKMPVDKSKTRKKHIVDFCQEQCTVRICKVLFDMHPIFPNEKSKKNKCAGSKRKRLKGTLPAYCWILSLARLGFRADFLSPECFSMWFGRAA